MKAFLIIILVILLLFIAFGITSNYMFLFALKPGNLKKFLAKKGNKTPDIGFDITGDSPFAKMDEFQERAKNIDRRTIISDEGLLLSALYMPTFAPSDNYVIICHGYSIQGSTMMGFADHFNNLGFNALLPDARAHGESEGKYISMGWRERKDILKWIDLIIAENHNARIFLFGLSMGGATVMMTSGEKLPDNVKFIIEDCGYSSVWDEFESQLVPKLHKFAYPFLGMASVISKLRAGYSFKEASAVKQIAKCKIPMLFIHGDADTFVPYSMLDKVYSAAECEKEKLVIHGAGHAMASGVDSVKYWETVDSFINKYINQ